MRVDQHLIDYLKNIFVSRRDASTIEKTLAPSSNQAVDLGKPNMRFDRIYARTVVADNFTNSAVTGPTDADTVDGFHASAAPAADTLLALGPQADFPTSVYPAALLTDGSRQLTANLSVIPGVTIDGVDISAHAASTSLHHVNGMAADDHPNYLHLTNPRVVTTAHTFNVTGVPFILGNGAQGHTVIGLKADQLNKSVTAGDGLTGGGALTGNVTLSVLTGAGLQLSGGSVAAKIGSGLEFNGSNALAVKAGDGIIADAYGVSVNTGFEFHWLADHYFEGQVFLSGNTTAAHIIPSTSDAYDLGSTLKLWRNIYAAQANVVTFAENTATLLGGWFVVGKDAGTLAAPVGSADTTINFGKAVTPGSQVVIRAADQGGVVKTEYITIGTLVSGTTYNVTRDVRNHSGGGADPAWPQGTAFQVVGQDGDGRIELVAYDTPRIQVLQRVSAQDVERVRIGDLNGWGPFTESTFGWAVGDYAGNQSAYYSPTTGLVVKGTVTASAGSLGALSLDGFLTIGASGGIYQGTGTAGSPTTGLKLWNDGGVGRLAGFNGGSMQWYTDTSGSIMAGGGKVQLNSGGLVLSATDAFGDTPGYIRWKNGTAAYTILGSTVGGGYANVYLAALGDTNNPTTTIRISADSKVSYSTAAYIDIGWSQYNSRPGSIEFSIDQNAGVGGVAAYSWRQTSGYGNTELMRLDSSKLLVVKDGIFQEGLAVGHTGNPQTGDVWATGALWGNAVMLAEQGSLPSTPASGTGRLFAGPNAPYYVNDLGGVFGAFSDRIVLSPQEAVVGNPAAQTWAVVDTAWYAIKMPDVNTYYLDWFFELPVAWSGKRLKVNLWWTTKTGNTGGVYWVSELRTAADGTTGNTAVTVFGSASPGNPGSNYHRKTVLDMGTIGNIGGRNATLRIMRVGGDAQDTLTSSDVYFITAALVAEPY